MANSVSRTLILDEIARRGWQAQTIGPNAYLLKIIHPDGRWTMLRGTSPMVSSAIGTTITKNKDLTLDFVRSYGYQLPEYTFVADEQAAQDFLQQHGCIVIKPVDASRAEGVTFNITTSEEVHKAFAYAREHSYSDRILVQEHLEGNLYRLVMIDGKLVAAVQRCEAAVTGNGTATVRELIHEANLDPRRQPGVYAPLSPIKLDEAELYLDDAIDSVPSTGESVRVALLNGMADGGTTINVTHLVHQDWHDFMAKISSEAKLFISGYDIISPDISQPFVDNYVPLLEINSSPALRLHEFPTEGEAVHVAAHLLDALFS